MARDGIPMLMLIDDEPAQRRLVSALAARAGWRTIFAGDGETAIATLGTQDGMQLDAIILDQWSPDYEPAGLIREIRERRPALPILILTAHNNVAVAVEAMRAGATDYLSKPIAPERLLAALNATISEGASHGELRPLTEKITAPLSFEDVVGSAPQFRAALAIAAKAARARVPVLIEGESGVGKDVIARAQICLVQWYVSRSAEVQADIPLPSGCIVALAKRFDEAIIAGPALGSDVLIVPEAALACANLSDWTWGLHCVRMPVFAATEAVLVAPKDWRSCSLAHVLAESAKELVDGHIICRALVFSGALAILGDGHLEWCDELDHCVVA